MKRFLVIGGAVVLATALIAGMLGVEAAPIDLRQQVAQHLDASGVAHPVTAVLLNYRGYDTLLEIAVLLLALLGILATVGLRAAAAVRADDAVTHSLARVAAPLVILVATYLLWAGAARPGGAFQAGAVLAAGAVLLHLAGVLPSWSQPSLLWRCGLAAGFVVFLVIAVVQLPSRRFLEYPRDSAGLLILAIEWALTLSLGLILGGLFLFLADEESREP